MVESQLIIDGVNFIQLRSHSDERGKLIALEEGNGLPFTPKRIFYISDSNSSSTRACHSGNSEELIIAINGSVTADLDNGTQQASIQLNDSSIGVWIRPGVWLKLTDFSADTILLVAASLTYAETIHQSHPDFSCKAYSQ